MSDSGWWEMLRPVAAGAFAPWGESAVLTPRRGVHQTYCATLLGLRLQVADGTAFTPSKEEVPGRAINQACLVNRFLYKRTAQTPVDRELEFWFTGDSPFWNRPDATDADGMLASKLFFGGIPRKEVALLKVRGDEPLGMASLCVRAGSYTHRIACTGAAPWLGRLHRCAALRQSSSQGLSV